MVFVVHRVIFGPDIPFPVPFEITTRDQSALFPVSAAELLREVGDVNVALLQVIPWVENWSYRSLTLMFGAEIPVLVALDRYHDV